MCFPLFHDFVAVRATHEWLWRGLFASTSTWCTKMLFVCRKCKKTKIKIYDMTVYPNDLNKD